MTEQKKEYVMCEDCGHENYLDPHCEVPAWMMTCDECGKVLGEPK